MSDVKVNIYTPAGAHVGYLLNPEVKAYPEGDFELSGIFYDSDNEQVPKLDINPEALPYIADTKPVEGCEHDKLYNVYVQRGRQPVRMSASVKPRKIGAIEPPKIG